MAKKNYNKEQLQSLYTQYVGEGKTPDQIVEAFNTKRFTTARGTKISAAWLTRNFGGASNNVAYKTTGRGGNKGTDYNRYTTIGILQDKHLSDSDKVQQLRRLYT